MIKEIYFICCILLPIFCDTSHYRAVYIHHSAFDAQRNYTTTILKELDENRFEWISYYSNQQLIKHNMVADITLDTKCKDTISDMVTLQYGNAYRYSVNKHQIDYCSIKPEQFSSLENKTLVTLAHDNSILVLSSPSEIHPDISLNGTLLFEHLFQLLTLDEFTHLFPALTGLVVKQRNLIVKEDEYTYQLLLLSKRNIE